MTWIMIGRIVGNSSRINSITCITQINLFTYVLFQISFGYISCNILSIKLTQNHKFRKINLKPIIVHKPTNSLCNGSLKMKIYQLVRLLLKFICLDMYFLDHLDQQVNDLSFNAKVQTFNI